MKKLSLIFISILIFSISIMAQITEGSRSMSLGVHSALVLELPDVSVKLAEKQWKKYAKKYGKTKYARKQDEFFTNNAEIASINGDNSIDVYARVSEEGDRKFMLVWFDLGGVYLNSEANVDKYLAAENFVLGYGLQVAKEKIKLELKDAEKELKRKNTSLKKLEKNKKMYEKNIEMAKVKIIKAEANIETNIVDQETAKEEIEQQKVLIQEIQAKFSELE